MEKLGQKQDKNLNSQLFLARLALLALADWPRFCLEAWASGLVVSLAMDRTILTEGDVVIGFSAWSLWKTLISFQRYCIAKVSS